MLPMLAWRRRSKSAFRLATSATRVRILRVVRRESYNSYTPSCTHHLSICMPRQSFHHSSSVQCAVCSVQQLQQQQQQQQQQKQQLAAASSGAQGEPATATVIVIISHHRKCGKTVIRRTVCRQAASAIIIQVYSGSPGQAARLHSHVHPPPRASLSGGVAHWATYWAGPSSRASGPRRPGPPGPARTPVGRLARLVLLRLRRPRLLLLPLWWRGARAMAMQKKIVAMAMPEHERCGSRGVRWRTRRAEAGHAESTLVGLHSGLTTVQGAQGIMPMPW